MTIRLIRRPYRRKPLRFLRPDFGHPQLYGCVQWLPMLKGGGILTRDVIRDLHGDFNDFENVNWGISDIGRHIAFNADPSSYVIHDQPLTQVDEFTVILWYRTATTSNADIYGQWNLGPISNGVRCLLLRHNSGSLQLYVRDGVDNDDANTSFSSSHDDGDWHQIVMQAEGSASEIRLYLDDTDSSTSTLSPSSGYLPSGADGLTINAAHSGLQIASQVASLRWYNRALSEAEIIECYRAPWAPFKRGIWVPTEVLPPGPIQLNIEGLDHAHPVDMVDVEAIITEIPIPTDHLTHAHPVDSLLLDVNYTLILGALTHVHPVDAPILEPTLTLAFDDLTHAHSLDDVDILATTAEFLNIQPLTHDHPVDSFDIDYTVYFTFDNLVHAHPMDEANVQFLIGDATRFTGRTTDWVLNAGQDLVNPNAVDLDWHVFQLSFNGQNSEIKIDDGQSVSGDAGVREITLITIGADTDGLARLIGDIAEMRLYKNLTPPEIGTIIHDELKEKWLGP